MKKVLAKRGILLLLLICFAILLCGCKENSDKKTATSSSNANSQTIVDVSGSYRNVKVLDFTGKATLMRGKTEISVYKDMLIQGEDKIVTSASARVDLILDNDKYLVISENTTIRFELSGDSQKGAIKLHLESGRIHNKIENSLSADDNYEVHTPDGVMAVRGTEFIVEVTTTNGVRTVHVEVVSGQVHVKVLNDKGEEVTLEENEMVEIINKLAEGSLPGFAEEYLCVNCKKITKAANEHILDCGCFTCDGLKESHKKAACDVHYTCDKTVPYYEEHSLLTDCGHYSCDGNMHWEMPCGNYSCDNTKHTVFECGCCDCEGLKASHPKLDCGCYDCFGDAETHKKLECGHYECEGALCEKCETCGEYICQKESDEVCMTCGVCICNGAKHEECEYCGMCTISSDHAICSDCGFCQYDDVTHENDKCLIAQ